MDKFPEYPEGYDDPNSPNYIWPDDRHDDYSRWAAERGMTEYAAYDADHQIHNEAQGLGIASLENWDAGNYGTSAALFVASTALDVVSAVAEPWNSENDYRYCPADADAQ